MKRFKVVSFLLVIAVTASLLQACASSSKEQAPESERISGNINKEGLPILKEKKYYRVAVPRESASKVSAGEKYGSILAEEKTNIHIEWEEIPSSGWKEKTNIMLASNDLPDAFCGQIEVMKSVDSFIDLAPIIEEYAPNIKEMMEKTPAIKKMVTTPDNKILALPINKDNPFDLLSPTFWINSEWLEKVGKKTPTTITEFEDVLRAFKTMDPNGNGKADEIPLGLCQAIFETSFDMLLGIFGPPDAFDYLSVQNGTTVVFPGTDPGYYEGLKWVHKLYKEGLIEPEIFTMKGEDFSAKQKNPDILYGIISNWMPDMASTQYGDQYVALMPPKGPDGRQPQFWRKRQPLGQAHQGYSITTNCKEPEVLIRYYDFNISTLEMGLAWLYGEPGKGAVKMLEDGKFMQTVEYKPLEMSATEFKRTVGSTTIPMYFWPKYINLEVPDARMAKRRDANDLLLPICNAAIPYGVMEEKDLNDSNMLFTDIDNYMKKFKANAVVEGITDAQWQEHLKTLEKLRVNDYIKIWQAFYDRVK